MAETAGLAAPLVRRPGTQAAGTLWRVLPACARYSLRVDLGVAAAAMRAAGLPLAVATCRAVAQGPWAALWLGPDEQLLIGPDPNSAGGTAANPAQTMADQVEAAMQGVAYSLVDISHRQGALEVSSPQAAMLLNTGCPLDLDLMQFPVGGCTRTMFAKAEVVLWRRESQRFHVEIWRSFLPYVAGILGEAEREFGP